MSTSHGTPPSDPQKLSSPPRSGSQRSQGVERSQEVESAPHSAPSDEAPSDGAPSDGETSARVPRQLLRRYPGTRSWVTFADEDTICREEPLELRLGNYAVAVVMRTPGHDEELGTGFCITEGIVKNGAQIASVRHCSVQGSPPGLSERAQMDAEENVLILTLAPGVTWDPQAHQRGFYASSSCGVCGKRSIDQALRVAPGIAHPARFSAAALSELPEALAATQPTFATTGAIHAAGICNPKGQLVCVREDVGRHNAVDKAVGWAARKNADLSSCGLVVSGRASFEIIQKALAARISCVVAVGGVSSLAVELAKAANMTLMGFARSDRLSVYSGEDNLS